MLLVLTWCLVSECVHGQKLNSDMYLTSEWSKCERRLSLTNVCLCVCVCAGVPKCVSVSVHVFRRICVYECGTCMHVSGYVEVSEVLCAFFFLVNKSQ